jgi:hypothetical protein
MFAAWCAVLCCAVVWCGVVWCGVACGVVVSPVVCRCVSDGVGKRLAVQEAQDHVNAYDLKNKK